MPQHVAMSSDGSTWVQGVEMIKGNENAPGVDPSHGVIKRFDAAGRQTGDFLPRAGLPKLMTGLVEGVMAASSDRIGWYANHEDRYYEVTKEGTVTQYPGVRAFGDSGAVTNLAVLDSGAVIAGTLEDVGKTTASKLYIFDRTSGTWRSLPVPGQKPDVNVVLYGGSQNSVALGIGDRFSLYFYDLQ